MREEEKPAGLAVRRTLGLQELVGINEEFKDPKCMAVFWFSELLKHLSGPMMKDTVLLLLLCVPRHHVRCMITKKEVIFPQLQCFVCLFFRGQHSQVKCSARLQKLSVDMIKTTWGRVRFTFAFYLLNGIFANWSTVTPALWQFCFSLFHIREGYNWIPNGALHWNEFCCRQTRSVFSLLFVQPTNWQLEHSWKTTEGSNICGGLGFTSLCQMTDNRL